MVAGATLKTGLITDFAILQCFSGTTDTPHDVAAELLDIGCCSRCVLRFMGEKDSDLYRSTYEDVEKFVESLASQSNFHLKNSASSEPTVPKICIACLGVLQQFSTMDFLQKIQKKVQEDNFQFNNFLTSMTTPVCVLCRQHAILLHLKGKFLSTYSYMMSCDIPKIKDIWKWRNGPLLENLLKVPFSQKSTFEINLTFTYRDSDKECNFLLDYQPDVFRKRKHNRKYVGETFTRINVTKAMSSIPDSEFRRLFRCPPSRPTKECTGDMLCVCSPLYLAGRYNKYSRTLSQTPWLINGVRKMEESVEELICTKLKIKIIADDYRFSAAGREDVDVKMLGSGRPFLIEFLNPHVVYHTQDDITAMQKDVNADTEIIKVRDLQIVNRDETDRLKEGEMEKVKSYSAICWSAVALTEDDLNKLSEYKDLKVNQKTPIRVLHRRPLADREKIIHTMSAKKIDEYHFRMHLSTQAGTYIKEFVHGDFGRTTPNMSILLGVECDILELDVEAVKLDWPKRLDSKEEGIFVL